MEAPKTLTVTRSDIVWDDGESVRPEKDWVAWGIAFLAMLISICAYLFFLRRGTILGYKDTYSHLEIGRRVVTGLQTGIGQFGGTWLPLQAILEIPLVWINKLYETGLAGSIVSMSCYVLSNVLIYKIVLEISQQKVPSVVGALIFMLNPDVLYMQSIPMDELLLYAGVLSVTYTLIRWIHTDNEVYLKVAIVASILDELTRYEAWLVFVLSVCVIVYTTFRKHFNRDKRIGVVTTFVVFGGGGIWAWILYNQIVFGSFVHFQTGEYSSPGQVASLHEIEIGNWLLAIKAYWLATLADLGGPIILMAIIGLIALLVKERMSARVVPILGLLGFFPFYIIALEKGQIPIDIAQLNGYLYNYRFGLIILLPTAIMIGNLVSLLPHKFLLQWLGAVIVVIVVVNLSGSALEQGRIITMQEAVQAQQSYVQQQETSRFLTKTNGIILMTVFSNEEAAFGEISRIVYEGNKNWLTDIRNPAKHHIRWIAMRYSTGGDSLFKLLSGSKSLADYKIVYRNNDYLIYEGRRWINSVVK